MAISVGAVQAERAAAFSERQARGVNLMERLSKEVTADTLIKKGLSVKQDAGKMSMFEWLRYPQLSLDNLLGPESDDWATDLLMEIEQDGRYAPYLARQQAEINDVADNEQIQLGALINYNIISGLSNEMVERLQASKPETLAAAARVRGITPAALAAILVHAKRAKNVAVEAI